MAGDNRAKRTRPARSWSARFFRRARIAAGVCGAYTRTQEVRDDCGHRLTAILPCNDLDASEAFYARLGFTHRDGDDDYRMLSDGRGGELHLNAAVEGWLIPGRNPFGLYLYVENVDELAIRMGCTAEDKPWGMYEFALSDPDETLVRVGWPTRLRKKSSDGA